MFWEASAAIGLVVGVLALYFWREKMLDKGAHFEHFAARTNEARVAFQALMGRVARLEEEDPELASDVKLRAALAAKKLEEIERAADRANEQWGQPIVLERVERIRDELAELKRQLDERPQGIAAEGEPAPSFGGKKGLNILQ